AWTISSACYGMGPSASSRSPSYFNLRGNKAYLFSGQPPFCRQCHSFGHTLEGCANLRCCNCLESGHMARGCKGPRRCTYRNGDAHLARSCPQKKTSYADALLGNQNPVLNPLVSFHNLFFFQGWTANFQVASTKEPTCLPCGRI
uniref:CCHC-type domain-containing protein n=1 Tax=Paramormyrops kingsleyae TaxID=1676925 RepID=A0A3B3Q4A8_9TELE